MGIPTCMTCDREVVGDWSTGHRHKDDGTPICVDGTGTFHLDVRAGPIPVCDLCGDIDPRWQFRTQEIRSDMLGEDGRTLTHDFGTDWAGCDPCLRDLKRNRPARISARFRRTYQRRNLALIDPGLYEEVRRLHALVAEGWEPETVEPLNS